MGRTGALRGGASCCVQAAAVIKWRRPTRSVSGRVGRCQTICMGNTRVHLSYDSMRAFFLRTAARRLLPPPATSTPKLQPCSKRLRSRDAAAGGGEVHMKTTRVVVLGAVAVVVGCGLVLHVAHAQQGIRRIDLQRHDLSTPGREVVQTIVELDSGVRSSRHTHPGEEIVYVRARRRGYEVEGKPTVTLKPGDVLFIPARTAHAARNVGRMKGAGAGHVYRLKRGTAPLRSQG